MARYALIVSGTVRNVIKASAEAAAAAASSINGTAVESDTAGVGDTYADDVFTPATPTVPVPDEVTMRQARLALLGAGLLDDVETALDALSEPTKTAARIEWDYSNTLRRHHPLVVTLGGALGLTSGQLDDLFIAAGVL